MLKKASSASRRHWPAGTASFWPAGAQHEEQHRRAEAEAERAEHPGRDLVQRDLHRAPVESPGEGQAGEHPPEARRQPVRVGHQRETLTGSD
jgi:hypothetical protein